MSLQLDFATRVTALLQQDPRVQAIWLDGSLGRGVIPFHKVGAHRRVKLSDALEYQAKLDALAELTREAQELQLGYQVSD